MVPHTAFPKCVTTATKATTNTMIRVHVTKAVKGTRHKIGGEPGHSVSIQPYQKTDESDKREGKRTSQPSNSSLKTTIWFCTIFTILYL